MITKFCPSTQPIVLSRGRANFEKFKNSKQFFVLKDFCMEEAASTSGFELKILR